MESYKKTGYLKEDFRYFHLNTTKQQEINFHYHDFHKILFFLGGDVTYHIEGRSFHLVPGDIILIPAGEIHKPTLKSTLPYERIIFYISPKLLRLYEAKSSNLSLCFENAHRRHTNSLRVSLLFQKRLSGICHQIEEEMAEISSFAGELYCKTLLTELLILLNRAALNQDSIFPDHTCGDERVLLILNYINNNLSAPLSIDSIAQHFFISRYYLMHTFKAFTGYTIGNYINIKRLLWARSMIQEGYSVTEACYLSGFQNYSTFARAYKKQFHVSARNG